MRTVPSAAVQDVPLSRPVPSPQPELQKPLNGLHLPAPTGLNALYTQTHRLWMFWLPALHPLPPLAGRQASKVGNTVHQSPPACAAPTRLSTPMAIASS